MARFVHTSPAATSAGRASNTGRDTNTRPRRRRRRRNRGTNSGRRTNT